MDNLIPLSDFDKRNFPPISHQEKVDFIIFTNSFEKIKLTNDTVESSLISPQRADPFVSGAMRCIHMIESLAPDQNLIPNPSDINIISFDQLFPWFKRFHKNMLYDAAKKGEQLCNDFDYPLVSSLATFRDTDKFLGHRKMPDPQNITSLLVKSFKEYAQVHFSYKDKISNPRSLEHKDWKIMEQACYKLSLDVCCIKPFEDGSNRVARFCENLLRLNLGLKFVIHKNPDEYLKALTSHQDSYFKN